MGVRWGLDSGNWHGVPHMFNTFVRVSLRLGWETGSSLVRCRTQTFKQFELEQLIKDGTVIPASKLAEAKGPGVTTQ